MAEKSPLLRRIGKRVRARRDRLGLTARELADRSELSPRFISQLENGTANIAVGRLDTVARVLGLDMAELVADPLWLAMVQGTVGAGKHGRLESRRAPYYAGRRPVALLGMRGAGKSTLGRLLADALRWPFVEVDEQIEARAGLDLAQIFTVHGEEYYRRLEAGVVGLLLGASEPMVLATSGGVVTNGPTYAEIRACCNTVWLRAAPEEYMDRVLGQGDRRPMEDREQPMEELRTMLAQREPLYAQADLVVDTSGGSPEATAEELVVALEALHEEQRGLR